MTSPYFDDPRLASARTLPSDWYLDPARLRLEQERVFGRTWQVVGHTEDVREPGDHFTCEVAGEQVIVVRDLEGTLRALSNVCRHRAGPVACGAGRRRSFQCAYHGWTYGLDGRLLTAPEFDGVQHFDRSQVVLPQFRVETWGPLVFVNVAPDETPDLATTLGSIPDEARPLRFEEMRFWKRIDYELDCNWKVYVDNYLEGYHIPIVHPGLFKELDYTAYRVLTSRFHSRQDAPVRKAGDSLYRRNLPEGEAPQALYFWLYPNLMLNCYPDNVQINVILPLGPERTRTVFEWYVLDPDAAERDSDFAATFAFSDSVQKEDVDICEAVQRGLRSRTYDTGRYSVKRENGVHHFHQLLGESLAESRPGSSGDPR